MSNFVICHRVSGLGDIMLQAANGLLLAQRLKAECYIDWRRSLYLELGRNLFGAYIFHKNIKPIESMQAPTAELEQAIIKGIYPRSLTVADFDLAMNGNSFNQEMPIFIALPMPYFDPVVHYPVLADFTFSDEVYLAADNYIKFTDDAIGIHYRHGNGEFAGVKSDEVIEAEMDAIVASVRQQCTESPFSKIFVSTDSKISEDHFIEALQGFNVVVVGKNHTEVNQGAMHYSGLESLDRNPVDNTILTTLVDMVCLSRCKTLYRDSWSSFTNWSTANILQQRGEYARIVNYKAQRVSASQLNSFKYMESIFLKRRFTPF